MKCVLKAQDHKEHPLTLPLSLEGEGKGEGEYKRVSR
jgi:hypothetical protein